MNIKYINIEEEEKKSFLCRPKYCKLYELKKKTNCINYGIKYYVRKEKTNGTSYFI